MYMVYPSRRFLSGKVRSFVDFISALFPHPEADPWLAEQQESRSAGILRR
jgi:hypothetical protein